MTAQLGGQFDQNGISIQAQNSYINYVLTTGGANQTGDGTTFTIPYNFQVVDNTGGAYNNSTGEFTAPYTGSYQFSRIYTISGLTSSHTAMTISQTSSVNGTVTIYRCNPWAVSDSGTFSLMLTDFTLGVAGEVWTQKVAVSGGTKVVDISSLTLLGIQLGFRTA